MIRVIVSIDISSSVETDANARAVVRRVLQDHDAIEKIEFVNAVSTGEALRSARWSIGHALKILDG